MEQVHQVTINETDAVLHKHSPMGSLRQSAAEQFWYPSTRSQCNERSFVQITGCAQEQCRDQ